MRLQMDKNPGLHSLMHCATKAGGASMIRILILLHSILFYILVLLIVYTIIQSFEPLLYLAMLYNIKKILFRNP